MHRERLYLTLNAQAQQNLTAQINPPPKFASKYYEQFTLSQPSITSHRFHHTMHCFAAHKNM